MQRECSEQMDNMLCAINEQYDAATEPLLRDPAKAKVPDIGFDSWVQVAPVSGFAFVERFSTATDLADQLAEESGFKVWWNV